jgi:hypothetical protein
MILRNLGLTLWEVWSKLLNDQFLVDSKWITMSCIVTIAWLAGKLLTTGYTVMLTPTNVLLSDTLGGTELDFTSPAFWDWYNDDGKPEKPLGCGVWYLSDTSDGNVTFPTCPAMQDQTSMTMAGVLAAQAKHASSSTIVRVVDKKVANSTGGVVPVGQAGLSGFADVHYSTWGPKTAYPAYNYSLLQQGLTADVKCKESSSSSMSRTIVMVVPVTNSAAHGRMILQNLTFADGDCGIHVEDNSIISSSIASIATRMCQPDPDIKRYTYEIRPFDAYANTAGTRAIPNITCSIQPAITINRVNYTSTDDIFRQELVEYITDPRFVPNETVDAVRNLMTSALTTWVREASLALRVCSQPAHRIDTCNSFYRATR